MFISLQLQVVKFYLTYNLYQGSVLDLTFFQLQVFTVNQEKPGDNGVLFLRRRDVNETSTSDLCLTFRMFRAEYVRAPGGVLKCMLSISFEINELVLVVYQRRKWTRGIKWKKDELYIFRKKMLISWKTPDILSTSRAPGSHLFFASEQRQYTWYMSAVVSSILRTGWFGALH